jgi:hypothetical protein
LEQAVRIVRAEVGPAARIVGATRVRRGGVGGFFAREHVELEVEVTEGSPAAPPRPKPEGPGAPTGATEGRARGASPRAPDQRSQERAEPRRASDGHGDARSEQRHAGEADGGGDPMSELITEMAENGPSSVLDLAERVNTEEKHYALAGEASPVPRRAVAPPAAAFPTSRHAAPPPARSAAAPRPGAAPAAAPTAARPEPSVTDNANFAVMLERIARESGLAAPEQAPSAPGPVGDPLPAAPASHTGAILTELRPSGSHPGAMLSELRPAAPPPSLERQVVPASPVKAGELSGLGLAVHALGLPLPACQAVRSVTTREELEEELCRALQLALPPLPSRPKLATSIVAVVGPRDEVMTAARAVVDDIGASREELAVATQRPVFRSQERVLGPADEVAEERRTWRWRGRPSVVAIEQPVRAGGTQWASDMLRALEPALCWGVAEASRKPEDLAAWSRSLGGIDVLALVDLEGTTTPAAALGAGVPVGTLDGQPATPELWASILCTRLMG